VALYVGGGHMVNAPYTGQVVRTDWIGGYQFIPEGAAP
jgi:cell wall-associated NlpC family hydrolase